MLSTSTVAACLARQWRLEGADLVPLAGGMNSQTWFVRRSEQRWVAKAVPEASRARFEGGLLLASRVEAAGIPAGGPLRTNAGDLLVAIHGHVLAFLAYVEGSALEGASEREQELIGATLARAHAALSGLEIAEPGRFPWLDPAAGHIDVEPWIRPAVTGALAAWERLPPESLTWGLLHSDPAPEAFRFDAEAGTCGLIDWDSAHRGPLMYDVASAVMYVGGPQAAGVLLEAYLASGVLERAEVDRVLLPMLRFRWAVQADYFALRVATNDLTGISGPHENARGLDDARRSLAALSAPS